MTDNPPERTLVVLLDGQPAGVVTQAVDGLLTFAYDTGWMASATATPLSLSMKTALYLDADQGRWELEWVRFTRQ